jgi:hypothetical protein
VSHAAARYFPFDALTARQLHLISDATEQSDAFKIIAKEKFLTSKVAAGLVRNEL